MLATLRQRNFALLWTAGLISMVGDWALLATLPVYVYEQTHSTLASGAVLLMYALSGFLVGSIAGVFVDRWDRRRTMIGVNLLQALVVPFLLLAGRDGWLWVVYLVTFIEGSLYAVFWPAESALLPRLVGEDRLIPANALNALNDNLARVIGPAIGALVLVQVGFEGAVLFDAVSYLLAALLIIPITIAGNAAGDAVVDEPAGAWAGVWREWREGLRLIGTDQLLRILFVVVAAGALADSLASPLLVPFLVNVADAGEAGLGLFFSVRGVAGLLGSVIVGRFGHLLAPATLLGWSMVAYGVGFLIIVNAPSILVIVVVMLALAPATVGWPTSQQTLLQTAPEDRYRGRVFGAAGTTSNLMALAGFGAGSVLGDVVGVVPLLNLASLLYVGAGVIALLRLRSISEPRPTKRGTEARAS
jgi:predicted MFS family arabinose efflux permease